MVVNEAEMAQLAVPNVEPLWVPINDPVNDPVLICEELETNPDGIPVIDDHAVEPTVGAHDADTEKDAVMARDAVVAKLALTLFKLLIWVELESIPDGILDSPI